MRDLVDISDEMKTKYQVTFVKNGYVVSRSIQTASSEEEAIELARMCHPVVTAGGWAVPVDKLDDDC